MLQVNQLNQYYGGSHTLRGVGFDVPMGKVTTLLGRNGVGKTSLLRAMVGQYPIKDGSITFDGAAPATLTRLAAASGAEFAFVSSLSPRSHAYRLRCPASDPGCGRALAALKAQPSIDYLSPDTLKDSR